MRVLFWISPITEMSWPMQKLCWLEDFVPAVLGQIRKVGWVSDIVYCVSEDLYSYFRSLGKKLEGRVVAFSQLELLDDFRYNGLQERKHFVRTGEYSAFYRHLDELFVCKVGDDYSPDVVISFNESPFLRRRFPDALILTFELSVFSRPPYPTLFCFDPIAESTSFQFTMAKYAAHINSIQASTIAREEFGGFQSAIKRALRSNASIGEYFSSLRQRYKHILLMPLSYDNFFDTLVNLQLQGQFEFVEYVMSHIGPDTCVVLTQHPAIHAIRPERVKELKFLNPNLQDEIWFGSVPSFSQVALEYCDGCIVGSSSLAYQAAFLGKYLISLDGFCVGLADVTDLANVDKMYSAPSKNRENYFIWVLKHLAVEMSMSGEYFKAAFPVYRTWRGKPIGDILGQWPEVLSDEALICKFAEWESGVVSAFADRLRILKLEENLGDAFGVDDFKRRMSEIISARDAIAADRDAIAADRDAIAADRDAIAADRDAIAAVRDVIAADRERVLNSRSWRWTSPLRAAMKMIKRGKR